MKNLAGDPHADDEIREELRRARIDAVGVEQSSGEVKYTVIGRLGPFTFRRAWYYWMVEGKMPIDLAEELYADPVGSTDIRVAGHCGCPPPKEWASGGYVTSYHIDTEVGLRLFADVVKKNMGRGFAYERR